MKHKLGKSPARVDAVKFKFKKYADTTALPTPPLRFGHYWRVPLPFGMLGNDKWGDCVWAGAAHETMILHAASKKALATFSDKCVLGDYAAATGFKYTDATDNGTDMQEAASYRKNTGIADTRGRRHKIDAYVALTVGDVDELMLATYLFGAVGIGLMYTASADWQFYRQQPWDYDGRSRDLGGHYVNCCGRNSKGNILCVTWNRLHAMTPEYYRRFNDETICYLASDLLNDQLLSPEGFDYAALKKDLEAL